MLDSTQEAPEMAECIPPPLHSHNTENHQHEAVCCSKGQACLRMSSVMCVAGVPRGNVTRCGTSILQSEAGQYVNRREQ